MFKKPNFFIIGAPKCGTTSLYQYLYNNPHIFLSKIKEPHFFNTDMNNNQVNSLEEYEKLFTSIPDHINTIGEASVWYLFSKTAIKNIIDYNPRAKFIVIIRNPVEMAPSLHRQMVFNGVEDIEDFKSAWLLQDSRQKGNYKPIFCNDANQLMYKRVCLLGRQIKRLFGVVKNDSVLILFLEDLKLKPNQVIKDVNSFLGVSNWVPDSFPIINSAKTHRNPYLKYFVLITGKIKELFKIKHNFGLNKKIKDFNTKYEKSILDENVYSLLYENFKNDIELIEEITSRDLSHWKFK